MTARPPTRTLTAFAALSLLACADKASWQSTAVETFVATIPRGADVTRDGQAVGTTPIAVPLPPKVGEAAVELRVSKSGWGTNSVRIDPRNPPDKVVLVLSPIFGAGEDAPPPPKHDDPQGLYLVGASLQRNGRCNEASEFLIRALEVDPRLPRAHRELGLCLLKLGDKNGAADHLGRYLLLAQDADDLDKVREKLDKLRKTRTFEVSPGRPVED